VWLLPSNLKQQPHYSLNLSRPASADIETHTSEGGTKFNSRYKGSCDIVNVNKVPRLLACAMYGHGTVSDDVLYSTGD
jgi:hypothetical protein